MCSKFSNNLIISRNIDSLIMFLLISIVNINHINADQHCSEQTCTSIISQWCCSYNTTCGNQNTCNLMAKALSSSRQSYCLGKTACFSGEYYWCCDSDQTCGDFRECAGGSSSTTIGIIIAASLGPTICIVLCCVFIRYRYARRSNNTRMIAHQARSQRQQIPIYFLTNNLPAPANPFGQIHNISTFSATNPNREESPPTYDAAVSSSTTPNQGKI